MRNTTAGAGRPAGVQSIARAAAVLRALERSPGGLGITELAAITELPKSTVHRIVAALAEEELLSRPDDGRVRLGPAVSRLGAAAHEAVAEHLRPVLIELRRELDETVDLSVLDGAAARFIDQVPAPRRLRATSSIGELFPLHCTANGKALLAALPDEAVEALLPPRLAQLTPQTITSRAKLLEELAQVRQTGLAFDREEHTLGIAAVGVAIAAGEDPVAAISVPVPAQRFGEIEAEVVAALTAAASRARKLLSGAAT
ncbi:MAG TPA: IclR family transcriptional regulator [Solirubrobacterales bacterium]